MRGGQYEGWLPNLFVGNLLQVRNLAPVQRALTMGADTASHAVHQSEARSLSGCTDISSGAAHHGSSACSTRAGCHASSSDSLLQVRPPVNRLPVLSLHAHVHIALEILEMQVTQWTAEALQGQRVCHAARHAVQSFVWPQLPAGTGTGITGGRSS